MVYEMFRDQLPDPYPDETAEWLSAINDVLENQGRQRARYLLTRILHLARQRQIGLPSLLQTDYINSIPPEQEPYFPGNEQLELQIRRIIRWNAAVMVSRANNLHVGLGGHLATYASAAGLYEVGFNHFFRGKDHPGGGDHVFFQGHAAPGIYARAYLEGRISEDDLDHFRREALAPGLSSYPHPRLMPAFWEFPTVSMGLTGINAIYQARFNRYLLHRGMKDTSEQRVWAFLGDGEMDEPESVGALHLAAHEGLDNLTFVVNCNLQRLDGPVRGNGKIIQELEALFRGAGWQVIKVIWGREWDDLLARDAEGALVNKMNTTLDGEFQAYSVESSGAYIRERFFGPDPRLKQMVAHLSDDQLWRLRRGGHDYRKVYAAYKVATEVRDAPTVILAKTVKGWALGPEFEARNATHQIKKMTEQELRSFAERLQVEIPAKKISGEELPFYHPGEHSDEIQYLRDQRRALGGFVPERRVRPKLVTLPDRKVYDSFDSGTVERGQEVSTTMAFVRLLRDLMRDRELGPHVVPIIPDEGRTFGMESLFKDFKIYSPMGQRYEPVDANMLLSYAEARSGQILEEGITEAGSMASATAAGTAYATHGVQMVPFFLFYSMFGFQRVGDLIWAFGDARGRGFLLGCTAGRTTLNGEGLQHEDGQSHLLAAPVPNCRSYDPAFAYETAAIVRDGLRRMIDASGSPGEDVFYYLTLYNENYVMPAKPEGCDEGILAGMYLVKPAPEARTHRAQLLGSGSILPTQVLKAQELLAADHDVAADVWSVTSYKLLREDGLDAERWNRLHPTEPPRVPFVTRALEGAEGPVVAASDWVKAVPDLIGRFVLAPYVVLGTDGYGRSDTRAKLRRHFEVDAGHIVVATLSALAASGDVKPEAVAEAIERYDIDPDRPNPVSL
ncbi:MAG TPA: pyruvate dehydrogenase (acetyl-transferring), homodimeric type [Actinomycetota bacterium]|nr:pyruvate dehydrogenase (acetyl-transferring), homodimeric type [Actinomycetota bacterium]